MTHEHTAGKPSHPNEDLGQYYEWSRGHHQFPPMSHEQEAAMWQWAHAQADHITALIDQLRHKGETLHSDDDFQFNEIVHYLDLIGQAAHDCSLELQHQVDLASHASFVDFQIGLMHLIEPLRSYAADTFAKLEDLWYNHGKQAAGVQHWVYEFVLMHQNDLHLAFIRAGH
jgi:hypothetical protein